jgi:hypothetical protein
LEPDWSYPADDHPDRHELFDEYDVMYPFPDDLFWDEGDEGEWDEEGAPPWRDVKEGEGEGEGERAGSKKRKRKTGVKVLDDEYDDEYVHDDR